MVVEVGELDEEDELPDFHLVFFTISMNNLAVQRLGNARRRAAGGQDVVEEGEIESVTFRNPRRDVAQPVVNLVVAVFLLYFNLSEVPLRKGQLASLADGDQILDKGRLRQQRSCKEESPRLDGDDIGTVDTLVYVGDEVVESLLVR